MIISLLESESLACMGAFYHSSQVKTDECNCIRLFNSLEHFLGEIQIM
jgi:hypothetical protein